MKKLCLISSMCLTLTMLFLGCQGEQGNSTSNSTATPPSESTSTPSTNAKTDIVIATAADFITMDPGDANDTLSGGLARQIMDGLYGFDNDMKPIPLLATSYEANNDATEFTFKLREGVSFSDGTPWNAEAAKINLDRMADQTQGLKRNSLFNMVKQTDIIDEYTIKIILNKPFGALIGTLAHPAGLMHSPKALKEYGKEVSQHPVGTGQFVFESWTPGEKLVLKPNNNYWGTKTEFTSVTFKPVLESGTRVAMLQAGDADFIMVAPAEQLNVLSADPNITVHEEKSIVIRYLTMNVAKKPFDNIKVRQALNYAIDKDAYGQVAYSGHYNQMKSLIGSNVAFFSSQEQYKYDPEKAKQLLAEAGYPDGFETTLWAGNTSAAIRNSQFLQQQFAEVGVKVKLENMEAGVLEERLTKYPKGTPGDQVDVQMYLIGWSPSTGDADWGLRPLAATESWPPVSYNMAYFNNADFDQACADGLATADPAKRAEAYERAQKIVWDEAPMVFLTEDRNLFASRNNISGIFIIADGSISLREGKPIK